MNPIWGPWSSSGMASENALPSWTHAAPRLTAAASIRLSVPSSSSSPQRPQLRTRAASCTKSSSSGIACPPRGCRSAVERQTEHADGVPARALVDGLVVEIRDLLLEQLPRVRPGGIGVRVVGLERHVVDTDAVQRLQPVPVAEEAAEDLPVVVGGRRLRHHALHATPGAVL